MGIAPPTCIQKKSVNVATAVVRRKELFQMLSKALMVQKPDPSGSALVSEADLGGAG